MKIYNTMSGKKEEFIPIDGKKVKIYACGITVYDLSHVGHARQAITYAMMVDYLRYKGYDVTYVRNYTDVDDKIIKRANELGKNAIEFSKEQIEETEKDMADLHITDADIKTKASEYIEPIIDFINILIDKGYAYQTKNGDVYYRVKKFKDYGKLSHKKVDELLDGVRIENDEQKESPIDFALWKSAKSGEIYWKSPFGEGRPGWHIECSVMALKNLGETIDIHGGGRDLVFPHHENEIAQSEAYTGKNFAKYWSHCGLIKINGEKMSKSLENSVTIREILEEYNYEVIKYLMFSIHYSSDMDISDKDYKLAERHMYYFYGSIKKMQEFINLNGKESSCQNNLEIKENFEKAMDDDFGTSLAIANLHTVFKYMNNLLEKSNKENKEEIACEIQSILKDVKNSYKILGFFEQEPEIFLSKIRNKYLKRMNLSLDDIKLKIAERLDAKKNKDYTLADMIRNNLEKEGVILNDTREGTEWDLRELH